MSPSPDWMTAAVLLAAFTHACWHAMLKSGGPAPDAPFDGLEALMPARDYKNRHASILLAWDATLAAMDEAAE